MTDSPAPLGLGVLGLGSVFTGPYSNIIQQLAIEGRVRLTAVYDVEPTKTSGRGRPPPRRGHARPSPDELIARDDVDVVLVLTSMNEHGALARARAERRQARARREADGDHDPRGRRAARGGCRERRVARLRAAHPAVADLPGACTPRCRTATSAGWCWPGPVRLGRAVVGRLVLPARRRGAVRPRRLQPHVAVRLLRPRAPRRRDGRHGDPEAGRRRAR